MPLMAFVQTLPLRSTSISLLRASQSAIHIFGRGMVTNHPLTLTVQSGPATSSARVIPVIERERALVRSRARGAKSSTQIAFSPSDSEHGKPHWERSEAANA